MKKVICDKCGLDILGEAKSEEDKRFYDLGWFQLCQVCFPIVRNVIVGEKEGEDGKEDRPEGEVNVQVGEAGVTEGGSCCSK